MIGVEMGTYGRSPAVHTASCRLCPKECKGEGFCPGDALSMLPCRTERLLAIAGVRPRTWREAVRDGAEGEILV